MADSRHVLKLTDLALKAFFVSEGAFETDKIFRFKEVPDGASFPYLVIASVTAERLRAKNWSVKGTIVLYTSSTKPNTSTASADIVATSDKLEYAVLDSLEQYIPADDNPQPLANEIQAAAVAAGVISSDEYLVSAFYILKTEADAHDEGFWSYSIDFDAKVVG